MLHRRGPMPDGAATSFHPRGVPIHGAAVSAIAFAGDRLVDAMWRDPAGILSVDAATRTGWRR
jgi:hypothetical protein